MLYELDTFLYWRKGVLDINTELLERPIIVYFIVTLRIRGLFPFLLHDEQGCAARKVIDGLLRHGIGVVLLGVSPPRPQSHRRPQIHAVVITIEISFFFTLDMQNGGRASTRGKDERLGRERGIDSTTTTTSGCVHVALLCTPFKEYIFHILQLIHNEFVLLCVHVHIPTRQGLGVRDILQGSRPASSYELTRRAHTEMVQDGIDDFLDPSLRDQGIQVPSADGRVDMRVGFENG